MKLMNMNNELQNNKESFLLYKSFYEPIKELSDEELGQLLRVIFNFQINPNNPVGFDIKPSVKMAFEFFKNQFRLDDLKYQNIVERNRANGQKGGRPRKSEDTQDNPENPVGLEKPKKADNDNENEKDNENDNEKENDFNTLFSEFWKLYPEKKSKKKAETIYKKLYKKHAEIMEGLNAYVNHHKWLEQQKKKDPKTFIPFWKHPTTWLNQECWKDEYTGEFKKEQERIKRNELDRKIEKEHEQLKELNKTFDVFRVGFLNKKFGEDKWSFHKVMLDEELQKELRDKFQKLYPAEAEILFRQQ